MASKPKLDIGYEILRAIRRILRKASEHSRQLARDAGINIPQLLCMRAIADASRQGDVTAADVSQLVHLSPPTVSRILDRLEQAGYLIRQRGRDDRRKVYLELTAAGHERLALVPAPLQEQFLARLAKLKHAERLQLLRALEQIVDMMEAGNLDAAPVIVPGVDVRAD